MDVRPVRDPAAEELRPDMENALIIFVKNLQLGKVKTRIAATLGDQQAYDIYKHLLKYTYRAIETVNADKYVFYSDFVEENDIHSYHILVQLGADLGERMKNAFAAIFGLGYKKVLIIGSDTPELKPKIIDKAFTELDLHDVVVGPATDGGYYLLGMNFLHEKLFRSIPWSTSEVLEKTVEIIKNNGHSYILLPELTDIDTENDWLKFESQKQA